MQTIQKTKYIKGICQAIIIGLFLVIIGCSDGDSSTADINGGSGIGGTGIVLVKGNVSEVEGLAVSDNSIDTFEQIAVLLIDMLISETNAQVLQDLEGIIVNAGGQTTTTNSQGEFVLRNVVVSGTLVLSFTKEDKTVSIELSDIEDGSEITLSNIVINTQNNEVNVGSLNIEPVEAQNANDTSTDSDDIDEGSIDTTDESDSSNSGSNGNVSSTGPDSLL